MLGWQPAGSVDRVAICPERTRPALVIPGVAEGSAVLPPVSDLKAEITDSKLNILLEHREGIEPSNTGFADQRVSHFATGAH